MNINEIVRILCIKRQTNVAQLSVKLGNTKQNLFMKLYKNDMKISDFEKIAEALNCDLKISFIDKESGEVLV